MKLLSLVILIVSISIIACDSPENLEPIIANNDCEAYVPFYEQQDTNALFLSVECKCLDNSVDLNAKLGLYTGVENLDFNCDESQFDLIPTMPSVTQLTSEVTTANIQAFPNLEVFKNKSYMDKPLAYQITFLPKLKEIVLFNAINFPDFIGTKPLDVFKMTFQNTGSHTITLPANLHTLTNLTELNIQNIEIAIFSNFEHLTNLEKLKLSNVLWVRIPQTANQWQKLKTLELSQISFRGSGNIPDMFEDMDSLETVYISETPITTTSQKNIFEAPNLKELTFSFCELETIPDEIGNLSQLEKLIISTEQNTINSSISLPMSVGNLSNLKSIFISINANQFPVALLGLKNNLESMTIEDDISLVPASIGDFTVLKTLNLNNCALTSLPSQVQNLSNTLEKLYLRGNNFSEATKSQIENWLPNTDVYF